MPVAERYDGIDPITRVQHGGHMKISRGEERHSDCVNHKPAPPRFHTSSHEEKLAEDAECKNSRVSKWSGCIREVMEHPAVHERYRQGESREMQDLSSRRKLHRTWIPAVAAKPCPPSRCAGDYEEHLQDCI